MTRGVGREGVRVVIIRDDRRIREAERKLRQVNGQLREARMWGGMFLGLFVLSSIVVTLMISGYIQL